MPSAAVVREHLDRLAAERALLEELLKLCERKEGAEARLAEPCRASPAAKRRK